MAWFIKIEINRYLTGFSDLDIKLKNGSYFKIFVYYMERRWLLSIEHYVNISII
jgi:hypothetical protein